MSETNLSFWDHLDELRVVAFRIIIVWVISTVLFFCLMPHIFDQIILAPCKSSFIFYGWLEKLGEFIGSDDDFFKNAKDIHLININLAAPFLIHISTSFYLSFISTLPYLLYQIWKFILPALYDHERKQVRKAMVLGGGMFFVGVFLGYFILFPMTLRFLSSYLLSGLIENQLSLNSYIENFTMLIISMGVACELPLVTWLLSIFGVIDRAFLKKYRKHAFVLVVILAAVITPTGDPFTLFIVALPLYLLYEMSILLMKKENKIEKAAPEEDSHQ